MGTSSPSGPYGPNGPMAHTKSPMDTFPSGWPDGPAIWPVIVVGHGSTPGHGSTHGPMLGRSTGKLRPKAEFRRNLVRKLVELGRTCRKKRVLNMPCQNSLQKNIEIPKTLANLDPKAEFKSNLGEQ